MIDDGLVRLEVEEVTAGKASCTVVVGGQVEPYKGVNVPGVSILVTSLTEKDVHDLDFALELGVDFVALSFVRSVDDVRDCASEFTRPAATRRASSPRSRRPKRCPT